MQKKSPFHILTIITLLFLIIGFYSCQKPPEFSYTPAIKLSNITKEYKETDQGKGDYVTISIDFTDGDGDLGLSETEDTLPPFYENGEKSKVYNNILISMYYKSKNEWKTVNFTKNSDLNGLFRRLQDTDIKSPIKGTIDYTYIIFNQGQFEFGFKKNDTVKFDIQIRDRALNLSNIITTNPLVLTLK